MFPTIEDPYIFENTVRNIARNLWPTARYSGATIISDKERDGVFETEECIHLLEATADRKRDKAQKDAEKLVELYKKKKNEQKDRAILCWLITRHEPTAEQRDVVKGIEKKNNIKINCLGFQQFQNKIIDASNYLDLRNVYQFGSIHDPRTDASVNIDLKYVQLDILDSKNKSWSVSEISEEVMEGKRVVLLGDYGSGKSMTLKEIYKKLRQKYLKSESSKFPIYINLRDHQGQTNPAEILNRHAFNIGFDPASHLIRAWRAGFVDIILDGFDEIISLGVQGRWRKLKEIRYVSMEAIRKFINETSQNSGLIIAGRIHYFDNESERSNALGVSESFIILNLNDFTNEQIQQYVIKNEIHAAVPQWMPSRPLLIGTLLLKGILQNNSQTDLLNGVNIEPGEGWDNLIGEICRREARIELGIDPVTIRRYFERLATKARQSADGLGPLTTMDIIDAFTSVCGYPPDEKSLVLVQRLPGLGTDSGSEDSRKFIDEDFADACRVGEVVSFINDPFNTNIDIFKDTNIGLGQIGILVINNKLKSKKYTERKIDAALCYARRLDKFDVLISDVVRAAMENEIQIISKIDIAGIVISDITLDFNELSYDKVIFRDCYFKYLYITNDACKEKLPRFEDCYILQLDGRVSTHDLPPNIFNDDCVFDSFVANSDTTDEILNLEIPTLTKVTLSILKKIYFQRGHGRLESALYRGLDANGKRYVGESLKILQAYGFIVLYQRRGAHIWQPVKTHTGRVGRMISAPMSCNDPMLQDIIRYN